MYSPRSEGHPHVNTPTISPGPSVDPGLTHVTERWVPKGVAGIITPWNYPFTLPATDCLPAIIAGNAVILKPDSKTPFTGAAVAALLRQAGTPDGVIQMVVGSGRIVGPEVINRADYLVFTGSTRAGRQVGKQCGERLLDYSAELGGKNPLLVLEDANPRKAAAGAVHACFSNAGQLCVGIERIYVVDRNWDVFVDQFVRRTKKLRFAFGLGWDGDVGSLIDAQQLESVKSQVNEAVNLGARVVTGGRERPDIGPFYYEPTILSDVPQQARLFSEETFGPVVSLYRVSSDAEAVAAANDSRYGLSSSVWSTRNGAEAARALRTGSVNVNEGYAAAWASYDGSMGGVRDSGVGRRHGKQGLRKYTDQQTVAQQRLVPVVGPHNLNNRLRAGILTAGVKLFGSAGR